jgi:hypothetical protein
MSEINDPRKIILEAWNQLPEEHKSDFVISLMIIKDFLGQEWLDRHLDPDQKEDGFFKLTEDVTDEAATKNFRAIDLAECLINLKDVEGFKECLTRMREAVNPEASLAELHIAKMLYVNQWPFRIVKPQGKRGNDYDLEIECNDHLMCGDTKCKLETTEISSGTITSTLKKSRDQLSPNGAGIFFIKIPQKWMEHPNWEDITAQGATDFFVTGTQRVVAVAFYLEPMYYKNGWLRHSNLFLEIANPRHSLREFDWRLFNQLRPPANSQYGMPPFWFRLSNFPTGMPGYDRE